MSDEGGGFDVLLTEAGEKKIPVIKVVRAVTGMGLKEAKALEDQAPSTLTRGLAGSEADALKSELEGLGAVVELHPSSVGAVVHEAVPARVVAKFAPGLRSIKLYAEGRIEYQGRTESIVGATARVDSSGSKRVFRDTREVFLMIEGPRVSIAAPLTNKGHTTQTSARKFAAEVNKLAMRLARRTRRKPRPRRRVLLRNLMCSTASSDSGSCAIRACLPRRSSKRRNQRCCRTERIIQPGEQCSPRPSRAPLRLLGHSKRGHHQAAAWRLRRAERFSVVVLAEAGRQRSRGTDRRRSQLQPARDISTSRSTVGKHLPLAELPGSAEHRAGFADALNGQPGGPPAASTGRPPAVVARANWAPSRRQCGRTGAEPLKGRSDRLGHGRFRPLLGRFAAARCSGWRRAGGVSGSSAVGRAREA